LPKVKEGEKGDYDIWAQVVTYVCVERGECAVSVKHLPRTYERGDDDKARAKGREMRSFRVLAACSKSTSSGQV